MIAKNSDSRVWQNKALASEAKATRAKLNKIAFEKFSAIGGDQEAAFEQSFASLAYTYLKDKVPKLLDYVVGFQLLDRNDDNTKAIGIFGFLIEDSWIYAPFFFLNGDLKGHELLYLKAQDMFAPMKENWLNYILSKSKNNIGTPRSGSLQQYGVMQPDMSSLRFPPQFSKYSSYPNVAQAGWLSPSAGFKNVYAALVSGSLENCVENSLYNNAEFRAKESVEKLCSENAQACKVAMDICEQYPSIGKEFEAIHGDSFFENSLSKLREKLSSRTIDSILAEEIGDFYFKPNKYRGRRLKSRKQKAVKPVLADQEEELDKVSFITSPAQVSALCPLTEQEGMSLKLNGYAVRDKRAEEAKSKAYSVTKPLSLRSPDETGIYSAILTDGTVEKVLVGYHPHSTEGRKSFCTMVKTEGAADYVNADAGRIFVLGDNNPKNDYDAWYKEQTSVKPSEASDDKYMVITAWGETSAPFSVSYKGDLGNGYYDVYFRTSPSAESRRSGSANYQENNDYYDSHEGDTRLLNLNESKSDRFNLTRGILTVPQNHKVIVVKKAPPKETDSNSCMPVCCENDRATRFFPGSWNHVAWGLLEKAAELRVYNDGIDVRLNDSNALDKLSALKHLVEGHGFSITSAEDILEHAKQANFSGKAAKFAVLEGEKQAAPQYVDEGYGEGLAQFEEPEMGYTSLRNNNVQTFEPHEYRREIDALSANKTDPSIYDPTTDAENMDQRSVSNIQQAVQSGQKEIFDSAMLSGLLKSVKQDSMVQRYIPDLLKAMDRIGRILFLLYWHQDEFADRYSKSDIPELEDSLRNSFEAIGDLALFLKERDVTPLLGGGPDADLDVDDATGD